MHRRSSLLQSCSCPHSFGHDTDPGSRAQSSHVLRLECGCHSLQGRYCFGYAAYRAGMHCTDYGSRLQHKVNSPRVASHISAISVTRQYITEQQLSPSAQQIKPTMTLHDMNTSWILAPHWRCMSLFVDQSALHRVSIQLVAG